MDSIGLKILKTGIHHWGTAVPCPSMGVLPLGYSHCRHLTLGSQLNINKLYLTLGAVMISGMGAEYIYIFFLGG